MFDDDLLTVFVRRFFGYGSWEAPIWFIGMEEGGGKRFQELNERFDKWNRRRPTLEDIRHGDGNDSPWFGARVRLQATWSKLICVQLGMLGVDWNRRPSRELVRNYQRDHFCRTRECLIELLPLPSRSTREHHWLYGRHSQLAWLQSRDLYKRHLLRRRSERIRHLIERHEPSAVIFYGLGYSEHWRRIAQVDFQETSIKKVSAGHNANTLFRIAPHPNTHGLTSDYFLRVGRLLAQEMP